MKEIINRKQLSPLNVLDTIDDDDEYNKTSFAFVEIERIISTFLTKLSRCFGIWLY